MFDILMLLLERQPQLEGIHDGRGDLVLDREDVLQLAVVLFGPEVIAVGDIDQLRRDAQPVTRFLHASLEHRLHVELAADLPDVFGLPFEDRRPRSSPAPAGPGSCSGG